VRSRAATAGVFFGDSEAEDCSQAVEKAVYDRRSEIRNYHIHIFYSEYGQEYIGNIHFLRICPTLGSSHGLAS